MPATAEKSGVVFTDIGAVYTVGNGNVIRYKRINGIYYHVDTPDSAVEVLEHARSHRKRTRIYYGDVRTGRDWLEEYDAEGYIGNSMGPLMVPLLIHNGQSSGGPALLDHCIVKIRETGKNGDVLYQHASYHTGTFTTREIEPTDDHGGVNLRESGYTHAVDVNGKNHTNFRSLKAAARFVLKMTG